ncbi:MAG TPA: hypothetical protein VF940_05075 [Streptosporangiaceae bacterium]
MDGVAGHELSHVAEQAGHRTSSTFSELGTPPSGTGAPAAADDVVEFFPVHVEGFEVGGTQEGR